MSVNSLIDLDMSMPEPTMPGLLTRPLTSHPDVGSISGLRNGRCWAVRSGMPYLCLTLHYPGPVGRKNLRHCRRSAAPGFQVSIDKLLGCRWDDATADAGQSLNEDVEPEAALSQSLGDASEPAESDDDDEGWLMTDEDEF
ncbi:Uu.00g094610.m01.CDS01 [Anthostomella pinea]|uniref:Uu.00g094610.m01.CDS01 n=1 Tax=Anthostomella pinea TaxID=933095 RepID=A0AAI8VPV4_9PEZI|nr:Uu.00g094610.m01.CDS01 [Anthostomella pinea]